jgi:hypothetical protein
VAKHYAIGFGIAGYLLAVWYYTLAFAPVTSTAVRGVLSSGCVSCTNITSTHHAARLIGALTFIGLLNALIYATTGYLLGRLLQRLSVKRPPRS